MVGVLSTCGVGFGVWEPLRKWGMGLMGVEEGLFFSEISKRTDPLERTTKNTNMKALNLVFSTFWGYHLKKTLLKKPPMLSNDYPS